MNSFVDEVIKEINSGMNVHSIPFTFLGTRKNEDNDHILYIWLLERIFINSIS